jgi:hypothetical protein
MTWLAPGVNREYPPWKCDGCGTAWRYYKDRPDYNPKVWPEDETELDEEEFYLAPGMSAGEVLLCLACVDEMDLSPCDEPDVFGMAVLVLRHRYDEVYESDDPVDKLGYGKYTE